MSIYSDQKANWAYWDILEALIEDSIRNILDFSMQKIPEDVLEENIVGIVADSREVIVSELTRLGGKFPVFVPEIDERFIENLRQEFPIDTSVDILKLPDNFPSYVTSGKISSIDDDGSVYVDTEGGFLRVMPDDVQTVLKKNVDIRKENTVSSMLQDAITRSTVTNNSETQLQQEFVKE